MLKYILRRLLFMIPVLLGIIVIVFTLMYITPGDPALSMLGDNASPEAIEALHEELGLNDPYLVQLGRYIKNVVQGDFGNSYKTGRPVLQEILDRYPTTLKLALSSVFLGILIGSIAGIVSAVRQYSFIDKLCT